MVFVRVLVKVFGMVFVKVLVKVCGTKDDGIVSFVNIYTKNTNIQTVRK